MKKLLSAMKMAIVATLVLVAYVAFFVLLVSFLEFVGANVLLAIMIACCVMAFITFFLDAYITNA